MRSVEGQISPERLMLNVFESREPPQVIVRADIDIFEIDYLKRSTLIFGWLISWVIDWK
jgi:hypothetical protein